MVPTDNRTRLFLLFAGAVIIASFVFVGPVAQDQAYYDMADTRNILGVPNFWNVVSNIPFLFVGAAGLRYLLTTDRKTLAQRILPELRLAYLVFFAGVFLTCFGSSWFHLEPNNSTLVWDRLPMTVAFMGLFTIVIGEQVCPVSARRLMWPLLLVGAASVFYWAWSESLGAGDLRPYALVQFLPMLLIPVLLLSYRSSFDRIGFYWTMLVAYAISKILEQLDEGVFEVLRIISGHSLKHVAAAVGPLIFLYGIAKRQRRDGEADTNVAQP